MLAGQMGGLRRGQGCVGLLVIEYFASAEDQPCKTMCARFDFPANASLTLFHVTREAAQSGQSSLLSPQSVKEVKSAKRGEIESANWTSAPTCDLKIISLKRFAIGGVTQNRAAAS